ncbi:MAG: hypothetical protein U7126_15195 [Microcoleus sp.]
MSPQLFLCLSNNWQLVIGNWELVIGFIDTNSDDQNNSGLEYRFWLYRNDLTFLEHRGHRGRE